LVDQLFLRFLFGFPASNPITVMDVHTPQIPIKRAGRVIVLDDLVLQIHRARHSHQHSGILMFVRVYRRQVIAFQVALITLRPSVEPQIIIKSCYDK